MANELSPTRVERAPGTPEVGGRPVELDPSQFPAPVASPEGDIFQAPQLPPQPIEPVMAAADEAVLPSPKPAPKKTILARLRGIFKPGTDQSAFWGEVVSRRMVQQKAQLETGTGRTVEAVERDQDSVPSSAGNDQAGSSIAETRAKEFNFFPPGVQAQLTERTKQDLKDGGFTIGETSLLQEVGKLVRGTVAVDLREQQVGSLVIVSDSQGGVQAVGKVTPREEGTLHLAAYEPTKAIEGMGLTVGMVGEQLVAFQPVGEGYGGSLIEVNRADLQEGATDPQESKVYGQAAYLFDFRIGAWQAVAQAA